MIYQIGDIAVLRIAVKDETTGLAADTTLSLVVQAPDNTQATYTSSTGVTHDGISGSGTYHYNLTITQAGRNSVDPAYLYRWVGTGAVALVEEGSLVVAPSILVPQPVSAAPQFTAADLVLVNEALVSGTLSVRYQDRTVVYQSVEALLKVRSVILAFLATNSATPIIRQSRVYGAKGW